MFLTRLVTSMPGTIKALEQKETYPVLVWSSFSCDFIGLNVEKLMKLNSRATALKIYCILVPGALSVLSTEPGTADTCHL